MTADHFLLWLRLAVSLLCAVMNGIDLSFNVYAVTLKETFNFTQTQVEITASMSSMGFAFTFLETLMTSLFGFTATFIVTWISMPVSSGLFALVAAHAEFFHKWPVFVYLCQLFVSTSNAVTYMVVTRVCLDIVPAKYLATYIGVFASFICLGKIVLAGVFSLLYYDMERFFVCFAVISTVVLSICYLLLYPVANTHGQRTTTSGKGDRLLDDTPQETTITDGGDTLEDTSSASSLKDMFKSRFFHMMFWPTVVFSAAGYTVLNNITTITDSIGIQNPFIIVTIISVSIMLTRIVYGLVFDIFSSPFSGFWLICFTYVIFGNGLVIEIYALNTTSIYLLTILFGCGIGPAYTHPKALLVSRYGTSMYSAISACMFAAVAVSVLIVQVLFGYMYDAKSAELGRTDWSCYGPDCFSSSFVLLTAITVVCGIIQGFNFIMTSVT